MFYLISSVQAFWVEKLISRFVCSSCLLCFHCTVEMKALVLQLLSCIVLKVRADHGADYDSYYVYDNFEGSGYYVPGEGPSEIGETITIILVLLIFALGIGFFWWIFCQECLSIVLSILL